MHLLIVRHGETEWNIQRRIQGWGNSALTDTGNRQIILLGQRLQTVPIAEVYASISERTQITARAAIGARELPFHALPELRETSWGEWEGKTGQEISVSEPELWEKFVKRGHEEPGADQADWEATTLVPGGESIKEASARINGCVSEIVTQYVDTDQWILLVGHGGSLRFVITSLLRMRPAASRLFHLDNASLTHFSISKDRVVLKLLNDSSHWSEGIIP